MISPPPRPENLFASPPLAAQAYVCQLEAAVTQLGVQVAELQAKLDADSSNSSRPPSTDGPQFKRAAPRQLSTRRRGGRKGRPKHNRVVPPPDEVIDQKPERRRRCDALLDGDDPEPLVDQVVELPVKLQHVVHHHRHTLARPRRKARTTAAQPPEAAPGFGPRLQAAVAHLSGVGRPGKRPIRQLLADLHGIPISLGAVTKLEARTAHALHAIHDEALDHTRGLDANVDETGWNEGVKQAWLWVAVTRFVTVFLIRGHRNRAWFNDLVGPSPGVPRTDRHAVHQHLAGEKRQVCRAHLRRDFQTMIDRRDQGSELGEALLDHAEILAREWSKVRDGTRTRDWFGREVLPWLRVEVYLLLEAGARCGSVKNGEGLRRVAVGGGEPLDVRRPSGRGADEQRGGACGASRGVLTQDEPRHRQRGWQSVRRADDDGGIELPIAGPRRAEISHPSHHRGAKPVSETLTPPQWGVNGYKQFAPSP